MTEATPLFLIGLICAVVGFVFGVIAGRLSVGKAEVSKPPARGLKELARLWRDTRNGKLHVEVEGEVFHSSEEVNPARHQFLGQVSESLRSWVGEFPSLPVSPQPTAELSNEPAPVRLPDQGVSASSTPGTSSAPEKMDPAAVPVVKAGPAGQKIAKDDRPNLNPLTAFTRAMGSAPPVPKPARNMIMEIDEILQTRVAGTDLASRAIKLMELPGRGMVVMVGLDQYEGIQAVPDPQVQAILRACVEEWERRQE